MKRLFLIPLIIVLAVGLVLGGCGKEAPAPAPSPSPTPTPTSTPTRTPVPTYTLYPTSTVGP